MEPGPSPTVTPPALVPPIVKPAPAPAATPPVAPEPVVERPVPPRPVRATPVGSAPRARQRIHARRAQWRPHEATVLSPPAMRSTVSAPATAASPSASAPAPRRVAARGIISAWHSTISASATSTTRSVHYLALLQHNAASAEVHNNLGLLMRPWAAGQAVRQFQQAIAIDPSYVKAHNNLGVALMRGGLACGRSCRISRRACGRPAQCRVARQPRAVARGRGSLCRRARPASARSRHRSPQPRLALQPRHRRRRKRRRGNRDRTLSSLSPSRKGDQRRPRRARVRARLATLGQAASIIGGMSDPQSSQRLPTFFAKTEHMRRPRTSERSAWSATRAFTPSPTRDPEAFWAAFRQRARMVAPVGRACSTGSRRTPGGSSAGRSTSASIASIGTCEDRARNKAALIWEGEPGDRRTLTYFDLYRAGLLRSPTC